MIDQIFVIELEQITQIMSPKLIFISTILVTGIIFFVYLFLVKLRKGRFYVI